MYIIFSEHVCQFMTELFKIISGIGIVKIKAEFTKIRSCKMAIIRFNPNQGLFTLKSNMDRLFDDFFSDNWDAPKRSDQILPPVDVFENKNEFVLHVEVPGIKKDDIKITFENNYLNISGEKKSTDERKNENYHQLERSFGKFHRSISIPAGIMLDKINAEYQQGVLSITIPKAEEAKPKEIEVKVK